jgi:outer membrane protein assembly factor BamB
MPGRDAQRTNRSNAVGPSHPHFLRSFTFIAYAVAGNGMVYGQGHAGVEALSPQGKVVWTKPGTVDSLVLGPSGNVIWLGTVGHSGPRAVELSPSGKRLWRINPFGFTKGVSALAVGPGGLYAPIIGPVVPASIPFIGLDIVGGGGKLKQHLSVPPSSPSIAPNGTIYYDPRGELQALTSKGRVFWRHQLQFSAEPMVGNHGVVYVGANTLLAAYAPSGRRLWRLTMTDGALGLAERRDGTIVGLGEHSLSAVRSDGKPQWTVPVGTTVGPDERASLIVDAARKIYVGTAGGTVVVVSPTGRLLARVPAGGQHSPPTAPQVMLSPTGQLIVNGTDGMLRIYGS